MLTPQRATAIYLEWQNGKGRHTMSGLARRYGITVGTVRRIIMADHRHTRHLPPLYNPEGD